MAIRYLRASGNWNDPVWAANPGGAPGSGSVPTASDTVYIQEDYTVTLTSDVSADFLLLFAGTLDLAGHKLSCGGIRFIGNTARKLIAINSILEINAKGGAYQAFDYTGSNFTFDSAGSVVVINYLNLSTQPFNMGSLVFNDLIIKLGHTPSTIYPDRITGSPTFRSLVIQSENSEAHTVNFDDGATILTDKFVAIGSSSSNRLTIKNATGSTPAIIGERLYGTGSSYGQSVAMQGVLPSFSKPYIGSNSTQTLSGWLLQDPPKISTLVDPLTTAPGSNANWTATGTINTRADGLGGGGYSGTAGATLTSTGTYDLIGSKLVFERPVAMPSGDSHFGAGTAFTYSNRDIGLWSRNTDPGDPIEGSYANRYEIGPAFGAPMAYYPIDEPMFVRLEVTSNGYFTISHSEDGLTWAIANDGYLNEIEMLLLRSTRIKGAWSGTSHIGSINMLPAPPDQDNTGAFFQFFH